MSLHELAQAIEKIGALVDRVDLVDRHMTDAVAALRGLQVNEILWSGSGAVDANGQWRKEFTVPAAAFAVLNTSAAAIQVVADTPGDAPGTGAGVHHIAAGKFARWNVAGRAVQVLGVAASTFELEALARPVDPVST
ncbi:MAG: hypothetical protein ACRDOE_00175 [Streptosporangiaceae bacterium]